MSVLNHIRVYYVTRVKRSMTGLQNNSERWRSVCIQTVDSIKTTYNLRVTLGKLQNIQF